VGIFFWIPFLAFGRRKTQAAQKYNNIQLPKRHTEGRVGRGPNTSLKNAKEEACTCPWANTAQKGDTEGLIGHA